MKGPTEKKKPELPHPVHGHPSTEPPPKRLMECCFLEKIPVTNESLKPLLWCIVCSQQSNRKESLYCPDCKLDCVQMVASGVTAQFSTSNLIPGAPYLCNTLLLR
jgi:hypothetical protein